MNHHRSQHDKAFLRTLLILITICVLAVIFSKAEGYGQASATPPVVFCSLDDSSATAWIAEHHLSDRTAVRNPSGDTGCLDNRLSYLAVAGGSAPPKSDPPKASTAPVPAAPEYPLSEVQQLRLDNLQLRAIQAQQAWNAAAMKLPEYQQFQMIVNALTGECGKVKKENKWPAEVDCDINQSPVKFRKQPVAQAPAK